MANKRLAKKQLKNSASLQTSHSMEGKTENSLKLRTYLQYEDKEAEETKILDRIKELWLSQGNRTEDLEELTLYLKPQDGKAYYVINDAVHGEIGIF